MKKITNILLSTALLSSLLGVLAFSSPALAQEANNDSTTCAGVEVSYLGPLCEGGGEEGGEGEIENSGLWLILTGVLNIMIVGVGVLAVAGIVYGSILYASAADNQEQVKNAMGIFRNVAIGLVTFAMMYSLLQFLIPGGIF